MPPKNLPFTVVLRSKDRVVGDVSNNFTLTLPVALPSHTEYFQVRLVSAHVPMPDYLSNSITKKYLTGGVEVCADFGSRMNSYDSGKTKFQSFGFLTVPHSIQTHNACINAPQNPSIVLSYPRFANVFIQLKDSDGNMLKSTKTSDGSHHFPPDSVFIFEFTPVV
jgi:hypothetical protein